MAEFINIEKYIEAAIIKTLRALFSVDPDFTYNISNRKISEIEITAAKPREAVHSIPNIFLHNLSYGISDLGLNNSYSSDIINAEGPDSEVRIYSVSFRCNLTTTSKRSSEAKDLANRVIDWLWIRARDCAENNFNLKITRIQLSPGNTVKLSENQDFYTANLSLEGAVKVKTTYTPIDVSGILRKVDLSGEYAEGIYIETELKTDLTN